MMNRNTTRGIEIRSKRKLLAWFVPGVLSVTSAVVLLAVDPVSILARQYINISPGSFVLEYLKNKVDGAHISVHLFNITNAEEFMSGKDYKLKMEEVGPFTYRETLSLENLQLDEEAGVMRYNSHVVSDFVPEESIGYPEDFNLTMPNWILLGLTSMVSSYPYFIQMAFNTLVRQQKSNPIITVDARSFLWGTPDPFLKIAKTYVPGLVNFDKIGIFDQLYNIKKNDLAVGATEQDKFMIKTRNGYKKLMRSPLKNVDICSKCDTFENTYEGLMYPAPVRTDTPIKLFRSGVCRTLGFSFLEKRVLENGIEGLAFQLNNSFFDNGPVRGLMDYSDCIFGFPIHLSKVHLEDVEPEFYERVDGIQPATKQEYKYNSYILIEPITGVQIDTYVATQANLLVGDVTFNSECRRLSNMVLPACYLVFKQPELREVISSVLKILNVTLPLILLITRIVLFLLAFILLAYFVRMLYKSRELSTKNATSPPIIIKMDEKVNSLKVFEPLLGNKLTQ